MRRLALIISALFLVSCQKKAPDRIEVDSAAIKREGDDLVCRVSLVNQRELIRRIESP